VTTWDSNQPPCPAWCTGGDHLPELIKLGSDYWHRGQATEIPGTEETPHGDLLVARVYLTQRVHTDERGWYRYPAEVAVESSAALPAAAARQLAALVAELAAIADDDSPRPGTS
jgi:hypothetical protein